MAKLCGRCKEVKDVDEFRTVKPTRSLPLGVAAYCIPCERAYRRAWQAANADKRAVWAKQDRERHPERYAAQDKRAKTNRYQQMLDDNRRRRARLRGAFVEDVEMDVVYKRNEGLCGICRTPLGREVATLDHVIPLSKGGTHEYANVQSAHRSCNSRKGAKLLATTGV